MHIDALSLTPTSMDQFPFPRIFLFDWDSTLVSSMDKLHEIWIATLQDVIRLKKTDKSSIEEFRSLEEVPHLPLAQVVECVFGELRPDVEQIYWRNYNRLYKTNAIKGSAELLAFLKSRGVRLGILSNHKGPQLRKNLSETHLEEYFEVVVGAGDFTHSKPDPKSLHHALEQFEDPVILSQPDPSVWFAGDSLVDLACGVWSEVTPVWVDHYSNQEESIRHLFHKTGSPIVHCHDLYDLQRKLAQHKAPNGDALPTGTKA